MGAGPARLARHRLLTEYLEGPTPADSRTQGAGPARARRPVPRLRATLSRAEGLGIRLEAGAPDWLEEAVGYLARRYTGAVSLSSAAAHVGVHPATLAAGFRRFRATSVGEHLRELRLAHARSALEKTRRPLAEIAVEAGFFDQAHLARVFRRRFGVTPAAYRRRVVAV